MSRNIDFRVFASIRSGWYTAKDLAEIAGLNNRSFCIFLNAFVLPEHWREEKKTLSRRLEPLEARRYLQIYLLKNRVSIPNQLLDLNDIDLGKYAKSSNEWYVERRVVTPADAYDMLLHSQSNRSGSDDTINRYAKEMLALKWEASSPISFIESGQLGDGHHRLFAQLKSKMSTEHKIEYGCTKAQIAARDRGRQRTLVDCQDVFGGKDIDNQDVSIIRLLHRLAKRQNPSDSEILKFFDDYSDYFTLTRSSREQTGFPRHAGFHVPVLLGSIAGNQSEVCRWADLFAGACANQEEANYVGAVEALRKQYHASTGRSGSANQASWARKACNSASSFCAKKSLEKVSEKNIQWLKHVKFGSLDIGPSQDVDDEIEDSEAA